MTGLTLVQEMNVSSVLNINQKVKMQVTPISQLFILPNETPVALATGTVSNISQYKIGSGQFGQWSFQHADLNDGQSQIHVTFKDRPAIPASLNGQKVYLSSVNGNGVKVKDDINRKNNTMQRVLWVTATGTVETQDAPGNQQYTQPQQQPVQPAQYNQQAPRPVQQQPQAQRFVPQAVMRAPIKPAPPAPIGVKSMIGRYAELHRYCMITAVREAELFNLDPQGGKVFGTDMGIEQITAVAATLFIQVARSVDINLVPNIFSVEFPKVVPLPTPEPTDSNDNHPAMTGVDVQPTEDPLW